jgi:hypothetical protein
MKFMISEKGRMKALANDLRMILCAAGHAEKAVGFSMGKDPNNQLRE